MAKELSAEGEGCGVAARGEQRSRQGGGAFEQAVALRRPTFATSGLEQLPHAAVGEVALELVRPRPQAGEPCLLGRLGRRLEQARLAEPGRRLEEHDLPAAFLSAAERIAKHRQLVLALQKRRCSPDRHLRSQLSGPPAGRPDAQPRVARCGTVRNHWLHIRKEHDGS